MIKPLPKAPLAVAFSGLFAACLLISDPEGEPGWRTFPDEGERTPVTRRTSGTEFRETVDLAPGGVLSIENDYGNIEITGWDREEVEVVARSATAGETVPGSARVSRSLRTVPEVEVRETGDGLLVRTPTFEGPGPAPAVDYEIRVPHSVDLAGIRISEGHLDIADVFGRLEVSIDEGDLTVRNFSGAVRASLGTGDADVEVLDLRDRDDITISARRGDIILRLEPGVQAIVEADAPRGEVRSDLHLGVKLPVRTVKGWIGQGGPNIILRTSDGRVKIVKIADVPGAGRAAEGRGGQ